MDIQPLTNEEIMSLDVASAQRKMGELDQALVVVQKELVEKIHTLGKAKIEYSIAKITKEVIIVRMRNLKNIVRTN